jgi:UDP-N-acetylglucosamine:LPS N-acetylglucosamine transferase
MILVPYPFAMSHQSENAKVFSKRGAAVQLDETLMSGDTMKDNIERLIDDRAALSEMGQRARSLSLPGSSHVLASEILSLSKGSKA